MSRCADCGQHFTPKFEGARYCFKCWKRWKQERGEWHGQGRECRCAEIEDHLPALLQLAHPDKHGDSTLANNTTIWLLSLRQRREAA